MKRGAEWDFQSTIRAGSTDSMRPAVGHRGGLEESTDSQLGQELSATGRIGNVCSWWGQILSWCCTVGHSSSAFPLCSAPAEGLARDVVLA